MWNDFVQGIEVFHMFCLLHSALFFWQYGEIQFEFGSEICDQPFMFFCKPYLMKKLCMIIFFFCELLISLIFIA